MGLVALPPALITGVGGAAAALLPGMPQGAELHKL